MVLVTVYARTAQRPLASATRRHWKGLVAVAVIGGGIPFVLFFEGLSRASSSQAAFLHKTLVLWVAALAIPLLGERVRGVHLAAIGLVFGGQVAIAGGIDDIVLGSGEMMILMATLMWSVEVIVVKRLLNDVLPIELGVTRMAGGAVVLAVIGLVSGTTVSLTTVGVEQLGWAVVTGLLLSAYVLTWLKALSRAPATDVTAVLVGSVVITSVLDLGPVGVVGSPGLILVATGVVLMLTATRMARAHV